MARPHHRVLLQETQYPPLHYLRYGLVQSFAVCIGDGYCWIVEGISAWFPFWMYLTNYPSLFST